MNGAGALGYNTPSLPNDICMNQYYPNTLCDNIHNDTDANTNNSTRTILSVPSTPRPLNFIMTSIGPCALVNGPSYIQEVPSSYSSNIYNVGNTHDVHNVIEQHHNYIINSSPAFISPRTLPIPSLSYANSFPMLSPYHTSPFPIYDVANYNNADHTLLRKSTSNYTFPIEPNYPPILNSETGLPLLHQNAILTGKYKTKLCIFWLNSGGEVCPYNDLCMYAHGTHELAIHQANNNIIQTTEYNPNEIPNDHHNHSYHDSMNNNLTTTNVDTSNDQPKCIDNANTLPPSINTSPSSTISDSNPSVDFRRCHEWVLYGQCSRKNCSFFHPRSLSYSKFHTKLGGKHKHTVSLPILSHTKSSYNNCTPSKNHSPIASNNPKPINKSFIQNHYRAHTMPHVSMDNNTVDVNI